MTTGLNRAGRRIAAAIAVAMVGMTALVFVAPAAPAATNVKFCKAIDKLESKLSNVSSSKTFDAGVYKDAGSAFKSAAKSAPRKVKKAMTKIGSFLSALGGGNATDAAKALTGSGASSYSKAIVTYSTYVATNCS